MKLRRVKIDDIKVPEVRVTARMDEETAEQFKESVKAVGVDEPPKVYDVDGVFYLSDGKHRLDLAKSLGEIYIDVLVRPGTMVDVLANNLMSGHLRGKHPVSEMIRSIRLIYVDHKMSIEDIVKKTGLTQDYVERLILISELTPMILQGLDEGFIGVGQAAALTKIKDPNEQEGAYLLCKQYNWKVKELDGYIRDRLEFLARPGQAAAPAGPPRIITVKCAYCQAEYDIGASKISNPNTCVDCASAMYVSIAQARRELAAEASPKPPGG